MKQTGRSHLVIIVIAILYAALRLAGIDSLVTTDEPFWLGRSANFFRALASGELEYTYQMAHPGVMTMWAGSLAYLLTFPEYAQLATSNLTDPYSIESVLRSMGRDPMEMMVAAKTSKILFQTLFFTIGLLYLRKLAGVSITIIAGLLMVFAPFTSGFDSALHVDGLFTAICFAAILAICWAAFSNSPRTTAWQIAWPWLAAGTLAGMALLTRATGMVLVGVVGLALLIQLMDTISAGSTWGQATKAAITRGFLWLTAAAITTFALLPALWVAPGPTMSKLWSWSSNAAIEGHENPTFYRGIHIGNPGYSVYLEVLAWRSSPVKWIGTLLLLTLFFWAWKKRQTLTPTLMKTLLVMLVFAMVYVAAMSVGAKKFDRYILPVFPVITLFAGTGIALAMDWIRQRSLPRAPMLATTAAALLIVGQAASWASSQPYRLDYYNPAFGGANQAQHILQMGWGQGGDQVISFLNDQTTGEPLLVQTSAVPSAFTYFLSDDSPIRFQNFGIGSPAGWYETDYYVAGIQQTQRDMAPPYRVLQQYDPVHTVDVGGVPYFSIYNVRHLPFPESLIVPTACNYTFGDEIVLMQTIGRERSVDLYFLSSHAASGTPLTVHVDIPLPDGSVAREEVNYLPAAPGLISRVTIHLSDTAANMDLQDLDITISVSNANGELPVTAPWLTEPAIAITTHSQCYSTAPPQP